MGDNGGKSKWAFKLFGGTDEEDYFIYQARVASFLELNECWNFARPGGPDPDGPEEEAKQQRASNLIFQTLDENPTRVVQAQCTKDVGRTGQRYG